MYYQSTFNRLLKPVPEDCRVIYPDVILTVHIHRGVKTGTMNKEDESSRYVQVMLYCQT